MLTGGWNIVVRTYSQSGHEDSSKASN